MRTILDTSDKPADPAVSALLSLIETWKQLIASIDTYKFACIEVGNNEAFELLDAFQRRQLGELEEVRESIRNLVTARCGPSNARD